MNEREREKEEEEKEKENLKEMEGRLRRKGGGEEGKEVKEKGRGGTIQGGLGFTPLVVEHGTKVMRKSTELLLLDEEEARLEGRRRRPRRSGGAWWRTFERAQEVYEWEEGRNKEEEKR